MNLMADKVDEAAAATVNNSIEHTSILEYLTNPAYYSIINKNNKSNTTITNNKEDVRFYRKRIIALTKDMLKGIIPSTGLKEIHDDYVKSLITYFKIVDKTDIIQDQYDKEEETLTDIGDIDIQKSDIQKYDNIDLQGFGLGGRAPSLNNYVVKTSTHQETRIIPVKLEVDLNSASLKTKGIKPKKLKKTDI
uniref:Uncharacterized protein n=1 Tax=viral metagenome TaxID=1070528 RepID=A0A6C0HG99_9ZZZZ